MIKSVFFIKKEISALSASFQKADLLQNIRIKDAVKKIYPVLLDFVLTENGYSTMEKQSAIIDLIGFGCAEIERYCLAKFSPRGVHNEEKKFSSIILLIFFHQKT